MPVKKLIVLFYPEVSDKHYSIPYAFLSLERNLRDLPVELLILDERHQPDWEKVVTERSREILLAGVSAMVGNQMISGRKFSQFVKTQGRIPIVWGGWFVTEYPEMALAEDFIDFIVRGQGEIPFRELILALLNGTTVYEGIPGLGYRMNGKTHIPEPSPWTDTYRLPRWNFGLLPLEPYLENQGKTFHYIASQGCPCTCNFCLMSSLQQHHHIHQTAGQIADDLEYVKMKYGSIRHIKFNDDNLLARPVLVRDLCRILKERNTGLFWTASAHIGLFNKLFSDADLQMMKAAGCSMIYAGAESGDADILEKTGKKINPHDIVTLVRRLHKAGIPCSCSFMICFPGQGIRDLNLSLKLILKLFRINRAFKLSLSYYLPLPANAFREKALALGFRIPATFSEFEISLQQGFAFPWITEKMKHRVDTFRSVMLPAIDKDYRRYYYAGQRAGAAFLFTLYRPFTEFRLLAGYYRPAADTMLMGFILKLAGIKSDIRYAKNSIMQGIRAIGY